MESIGSCLTQCLHFAIAILIVITIVLPDNLDSTSTNGTISVERPSYARLLSGPPLSCTYQGRKYPHGEQVITSEPCLNCTCKRGVLLCFLRVCPSLIHLHVDENCETIREPGQCCPTVRCTSRSAPVTLTTDPTDSWPEEREESSGSGISSNDHDSQTTPSSPPQEVANSLTSELNAEFDSALRTKLAKGSNNRIVVTHGNEGTVFQTNPSTVFHDSPKLVTSSPGHYSYSKDDVDNFPTILNRINRDCYLNSTLYAEGSAVMSSSYCEYCYCIRGKKMCIRPRCHLAILGCIPRYTSEFACCPTSYICGNSPNPSISLDERTLAPSSSLGYTSPVKSMTTLPSTLAYMKTTSTTTSTTSTTTTTTTTTTPGTPAMANSVTTRPLMASTSGSDYAFSRKVCRVNGIIYQLGDHVPSDVACQNCYCSYGGAKRCKKIHCSPVMEGCVPIIPEGHCCPTEYKCHGGTKARADTSLEKEIPGETTTIETVQSNSTSQPWLTTSLSDIEISTDPVDSELIESTSVSSVELKSSELIKNTLNPPSGMEGLKALESVDRSIEFGKAISKDKPISSLLYSTLFTTTKKPTEVTTTTAILPPAKNDLLADHLGVIEARSSIDSDLTDLSEEIDIITTTSTIPASLSTNFSSTPTTNVTMSTNASSLSTTTSSPLPILLSTTSATTLPSPAPTTTKTTTPPSKKSSNSWFRLDGQREPDGVELFLGGIIEALERRIQNALPAESRLPLDKKETDMKDLDKVNRQTDQITNNDNNDSASKLPDFYSLSESKINHGSVLKSNESEFNETLNADKPVIGTIMVKPEADEHLKYGGSAYDPSNVEIITAATPLLHDIAQIDSILVNLSSSSFKVSTDELKDEKFNINGSVTTVLGSPISPNSTNQTDTNLIKPLTVFNFGKDEWKVINHNHRPLKIDSDLAEPFGYKYRSEDIDMDEPFDLSSNSTEIDKKSRSEIDSEASYLTSSLHPSPGQGYPNNVKYIPFGSGDVSANFPVSHTKPNSSFSIRLPQNRKPQINSQKQSPIMTSCRIGDQEYTNGAMITKSDPCVRCRCFYGRELCHQQKCPPPPRHGCELNFVEGYCCPRYICKLSDDTSSINPAIAMNPGLQSFQKPSTPQQPQSSLPVQPPKLGYIPLNGLPISAESEIHKETVAPSVNNFNNNQRPMINNNVKDKLNGTGSHSLHHNTDLTFQNNRPKQQSPLLQQSTNINKQTVSNAPSILDNNSGKNRVHFPAGKPESFENVNMNISNESASQGGAILPSRFPNLLPHLFKQSAILNNSLQPSIGQSGSNNNNFNKRPFMSNKKPSWPSSLGPQVRPGPQHRPGADINRFSLPTSRPEFAISTTSIDLLRLTKPTTEKDIVQPPSSTFNISPSSSSSLPPLSPSSSSSPSDEVSSSFSQISTTIKPSNLSPVNQPSTEDRVTSGTGPISDPFFAQVLNHTGRQPDSSVKKPQDDKSDSSPTGMSPSPWDALRVSGCNIYGTFYKVDQVIDELSSSCKKCFCSSFGVQCNKVC